VFEGMILMCGPDHRIEYMNGRFMEQAGRDARGEDCREFLNETSGKCPIFLDDRAFEGEVVRWEAQCPGDGRWFSIVNVPIHGEEGKTSLIVMVYDITERKRIEQSVRESRERYVDLVETVQDWIWEVDAKGMYTFSNRRVTDLLGYDPSEVLGKTCMDFLMPFEVERISTIFRTCVEAQEPIIALENICRHKDGHPVVVETSGRPFFDSQGALAGYRGVDRDISERRKFKHEAEPRS
jgi:PAS domain S-box-containing protein